MPMRILVELNRIQEEESDGADILANLGMVSKVMILYTSIKKIFCCIIKKKMQVILTENKEGDYIVCRV